MLDREEAQALIGEYLGKCKSFITRTMEVTVTHGLDTALNALEPLLAPQSYAKSNIWAPNV